MTLRLVANEAVLGYYPRPDWRVVNWLLYTYLVPAAAMIFGAQVLFRFEVSRARDWEEPIYSRQHPVGAIAAALGAIAVTFVWINLAIADWFATGDTLRVSFERMPGRDLTTSIAWAVYALALLGTAPLGQQGVGLLGEWLSAAAACAIAGGTMLLLLSVSWVLTPVRSLR